MNFCSEIVDQYAVESLSTFMVARGAASRGVPCADTAPVEMAMLAGSCRAFISGWKPGAQGGERFMPPRKHTFCSKLYPKDADFCHFSLPISL